MITVLTGENSFEVERALQQIVASFDGVAEKFDGSSVTMKQLPDLLMGGTLFAQKRCVVVRGLADNKSLWNSFADWIVRVSSDVSLVLVEPKLDKRTKTYKGLQPVADIQEYKVWTDRDSGKAEQWVVVEAHQMGMTIDKKCVQLLVARVGVNQWQLRSALQKLAFVDQVSPEVVESVIDASPSANVFDLFEAALKGDGRYIQQLIASLSLTEIPQLLFGLLSGQAFQLAALTVTDESSAAVAKAIGAHPFALQKLAPYARRLGPAGAKKVIAAFAEADAGIKTSQADPWLLIERALLKVAHI